MILYKLLTLILSSFLIFGNANQNIPGQLKTSPYEKNYKKRKIKDHYKDLPLLKKPPSKWKEKYSSKTHLINPQESKYLEYDPKKILLSQYKKAKYSFEMRYIKNHFQIENTKQFYSRAFKDQNNNNQIKSGLIQLEYRKFLSRKNLDLFYNLALGFSLDKAKLAFIDGEVSKATISIWTIPFDFGIGATLNLGRKVSLTALIHGSIAGILQSRNDKENKDRKAQVGYGHGVLLSVNFSIFHLFPKMGISLSSKNNISNFTFSIFSKTTYLSQFADPDLKINGQSIGIGLIFELL